MKSRVFHIKEYKPVVYTYKVYAKSKADAWRKYHDATQESEEIGLDPGTGKSSLTISDMGVSSDKCAECTRKIRR